MSLLFFKRKIDYLFIQKKKKIICSLDFHPKQRKERSGASDGSRKIVRYPVNIFENANLVNHPNKIKANMMDTFTKKFQPRRSEPLNNQSV